MKGTTTKPANCICRDSDCHGERRECGKALPVPRGVRKRFCDECLAQHVPKVNNASYAQRRARGPLFKVKCSYREEGVHTFRTRDKRRRYCCDAHRDLGEAILQLAIDRRSYAAHLEGGRAKSKAYYAALRQKVEEVESLRAQVEAGKAAEAKLKEMKIGRTPERELAARLQELYMSRPRPSWKAIAETVKAEGYGSHPDKTLSNLRARHYPPKSLS